MKVLSLLWVLVLSGCLFVVLFTHDQMVSKLAVDLARVVGSIGAVVIMLRRRKSRRQVETGSTSVSSSGTVRSSSTRKW